MSGRRPGSVWVLLAVLGAELLGAAALFVVLLGELAIDTPTSLETALALVVVLGIAVAALGAITIGVWRGTSWVRAPAVVFQVLIAAIGVGALQGAFAQPEWGWPLVAIGVLGFVLLIARPTAVYLSGSGEAS